MSHFPHHKHQNAHWQQRGDAQRYFFLAHSACGRGPFWKIFLVFSSFFEAHKNYTWKIRRLRSMWWWRWEWSDWSDRTMAFDAIFKNIFNNIFRKTLPSIMWAWEVCICLGSTNIWPANYWMFKKIGILTLLFHYNITSSRRIVDFSRYL